MDPQAILKLILDKIRNPGNPADDNENAELVDALRNLADWIERGGFIPTLP